MKFNLPSLVPKSKATGLCIVLLLASFLSFWKLGLHPLFEWDESRYAVNAYEMITHHDYVNYYFSEQIDLTVSKPPLYLWAITISYRMFGYNEFALRFFSALATVIFFLVFYKWVSLYKGHKTAFYACLVLMSCKAIISYHAGRTGDMDSFLLLFTYLALYHFSRYLDFNKRYAILWTGIFFGLAFYSKGTAAFLLFPSLLVFIIWRKKLLFLLKDFRFWLAALFFLVISGSWYFLVMKFGIPFNDSISGAHNNWQQLLYYDTIIRMTHAGVGGDPKAALDQFFYFKVLDSRFNLWNYLLYLCSGLFLIVNFTRLKCYFKNPFYLLLLICISVSSLLLSFSLTKLSWWYTPVIPMISVFVVMLVESLSGKFPIVKFVSLGLFVFTITRQFILINESSGGRGVLFRDNKTLFQNSSVTYWYESRNEQDLFAYLDWYSKKTVHLSNKNLQSFINDPASVLFGGADDSLRAVISFHPELKHQQAENYLLVYH